MPDDEFCYTPLQQVGKRLWKLRLSLQEYPRAAITEVSLNVYQNGSVTTRHAVSETSTRNLTGLVLDLPHIDVQVIRY